MSDDTDLQAPDLLTTLKARADLMGIKYHPSIGLEKLQEKLEAHRNGEPQPDEETIPVTSSTEVGKETKDQKRARLKREANELVRVRVQCMNPLKKEWDGEIFTAGNSTIGSLKKFVPFGSKIAEDGWHIPRIILNMMEARQFQTFTNKKTKNGVTVREGKLVKEFAIEILPPLTEAELKDLAHRQALAGTIE